ncbi:MAG: hypothetical protein RXQ68_01455 [Candidatus Nanopusillus sp.]
MKSISLKTAAILLIVMIVIIAGIYYGYNILNNAIYVSFNSNNYQITIYNTQNISTPSPFQQDIAICNGTLNIGNNFAYVNNPTIFNQINLNGQNVLFFNSNRQLLYSWYEGQLINGSTYCDVWWVNLPNGIPANSNVIIYMHIGNSSDNYYSQYYPYIGASPQVISEYDNGQDVFIAYGYFNNTFDGWKGYSYLGPAPTVTPDGIEIPSIMGGSAYILPPNNWNIPEIPLIVEEAWYYNLGIEANGISLFGDTNNQLFFFTLISNLSTCSCFSSFYGRIYLTSAVTYLVLNSTASYLLSEGTIYSYLIVNSTYAQTGYYIYSPFSFTWAPLTLLDTYSIDNNGYTYANLNYNPYQYPTLEISMSRFGGTQYVEWVVARAYPPNGVMPSTYIS